MARILIVEDEPDLRMSLEEDIRRQGHETTVAEDGARALELGRKGPWDLILLDVMLPKMDGFDVCAALRKSGVTAPVVMLTARTQEAEKVFGLDSGADDYITKPFGLHELRARIRAQLRRGAGPVDRVRRFGDCVVDFDRATLRRAGQPVDITPQELRLLEVLLDAGGRVVSRDHLIEAAWGPGTAITDRAVDTHIFNLRKKIEPLPSDPCYLLSVRGLGYRFGSGTLTDS
ncbi:MAG: response regulator transcription factor [Acidobacteria bacterium]|nr:response regulator transcription factor [Acidobacteriota bacterium]